MAEWVLEHGQPAGLGTATLPVHRAVYLPIGVGLGVLGARPLHTSKPFDPMQFHLLETFGRLTALAIERAELAETAERTRMQMEAERLRNSLLSAVSHDLRMRWPPSPAPAARWSRPTAISTPRPAASWPSRSTTNPNGSTAWSPTCST